MRSKRGQQLSTNAIILIILGMIILVVLIIGFTMGWKNIAPWMSGSNVNTIVNQCKIACTTGSVYDYCSKSRELRDGDKNEFTENCYDFAIKKDEAGSLIYAKYGIAECPGITCP